MSESTAFASLGPMLLARKGTAKPAMRVQLTQNDRTATLGDDLAELAASQTALGWDDMGFDETVVQLPVANDRAPFHLKEVSQGRRKAVDQGRRAAFTLRLDTERHLKLRLAATIRDCSAQDLVTQALDQLFDDITELESIAAHVAGKKRKG